MAFTNQFALTVELTRLLPPIINKAADAIMNRARELRHSGSDIVVEEDLANVFGRCQISNALSSSFRTVVSKSTSNIHLLEGITLQAGPGPTVIRAFQDSPYFAMVVQLSLLVWTFHANYLATALAEALRKRSDGAPASVLQWSPDRGGILKVLWAIESQTSAFDWNLMLNAVSTTLGYTPNTAPIDFQDFVLQGLLDMFPMVQTLPNDRLIHIQIPVGDHVHSGISALVVWAHHVLNLTVLVRSRGHDRQSGNTTRFGNSDSEQILIEEVAVDHDASIILLDSQRTHLLTIKPDPDADGDSLIGFVRRIPAKGWGNAILSEELGSLYMLKTHSRAVFEDIQTVTSAFAFIVAKNLIKDDSERYDDEEIARLGSQNMYKVDEKRLLLVCRFLFDNPRIDQTAVNTYVAQYSLRELNYYLPKPPSIEASSRANAPAENRESVIDSQWDEVISFAKKLSVLMLALAHVANPEACEDLVFTGSAFSSISEHPLVQQLEDWNGQDSLRVQNESWLQAVAVPLIGHSKPVWNQKWNKTCLVSDKGWSAWITTFGDLDPAYISVGSVYLGRGSPCRNGIWKTGIWDSQDTYFQFNTDPKRVEVCGQTASLRCVEKVAVDSPYCGEGDDVFLVSARLRLHKAVPNQKTIHRVGYKALQKFLWWAKLSERCLHGNRMRNDIKLGIDCATVAGFGNYLEDSSERILIYLTAHSLGARWLALATLQYISVSNEVEVEASGLRQILLRVNDCCFQCAIDQAAAKPGKWFIIL